MNNDFCIKVSNNKHYGAMYTVEDGIGKLTILKLQYNSDLSSTGLCPIIERGKPITVAVTDLCSFNINNNGILYYFSFNDIFEDSIVINKVNSCGSMEFIVYEPLKIDPDINITELENYLTLVKNRVPNTVRPAILISYPGGMEYIDLHLEIKRGSIKLN